MDESSKKFYERLLRLGSDWEVTDVYFDEFQDTVHVSISYRHKY